MKSAAAAFASLIAGVLLGYAAFGVMAPSGVYGRDFRPILMFTAFFLVVTGLIHGRWWLRGAVSFAAGIAAFAAVISWLVMYFSGGWVIDPFTLGWILPLLLATLLPWLLGVGAGKWSRRFQLAE